MPTLTDQDLSAYRYDPVAALNVDPLLAICDDGNGGCAFLRLIDGKTRCKYCSARWTVELGNVGSRWSFERARNGVTVGTCGPCADNSYW